MSTNKANTSYDSPFIGYGYDLLARFVFAPVGGLEALREAALAAIGVKAGMRVLELGCGTGGLTRKLIKRGAEITAVDWSEPMLRRARRRAPAATFEPGEITAYTPKGRYDRVLLAFVLHELDLEARQRALELARDALTPDGAVAIVDHAIPKDGLIPRAVSAFVHSFEPPTTVEWLRGGFDAELLRSGLTPETKQSLARGTAIVVVSRRTASRSSC
jgi:ubiquinone/menaquinone biosynthesis C-methylase UbiE